MPGGRPRLPTRVLQLRGTHRPDRHGQPEDEPQFTALVALPKPPRYLDRVAKAEWRTVGKELVAQRLLTIVDLNSFAAYCVNVSRLVRAEELLAKSDILVKTPHGVQGNPAIAIQRQAGVEIRKFAQEFGFTPSARTRLRTPTGAPQTATAADPWDAVGR